MNRSKISLILYDGHCNLCNRSVRFIRKRDRKKIFRFFPLQSDEASAYRNTAKSDEEPLSTLILVEGDKVFTQSVAVLRISRRLRFPWFLLYGLIVIPTFLRDWIYRLISKNRFKWFGRSEDCMLIDTPDSL